MGDKHGNGSHRTSEAEWSSGKTAGITGDGGGADDRSGWLSPEEAAPLAGALREFPGYLALAEDGEIGMIERAFDREGGVLVVAADGDHRIVPASAVVRVDHGTRTVALRIRRDRVCELPRWDDTADDEQVSPEVVYAAALVLLEE